MTNWLHCVAVRLGLVAKTERDGTGRQQAKDRRFSGNGKVGGRWEGYFVFMLSLSIIMKNVLLLYIGGKC